MKPTTEHHMKKIALHLYEQTKHGRRTTCRQVAEILEVEFSTALCAINLAQAEPIETAAGLLTIAPAGSITGPGWQPTATYMATLTKVQLQPA